MQIFNFNLFLEKVSCEKLSKSRVQQVNERLVVEIAQVSTSGTNGTTTTHGTLSEHKFTALTIILLLFKTPNFHCIILEPH